VGGVLALGNVTRRPEGAAERFLQALSSKDAKGIDKFGSTAALPNGFEVAKLPKDFDRIEVGRAFPDGAVKGVDYRVEVRKGRILAGILLVEHVPHSRDWKVTGSAPATASGLRVPSEGGPKPAGAPRSAWLLAVVTVLALALLCELLLRGLLATAPSGARAEK